MTNFPSKDKEIIKAYNKKYYEEKKLEKGLRKINCEFCDKPICSNSMKYHQSTPNCRLVKLLILNQQANI